MKFLHTKRWPALVAAIALVATMTGAVFAQSISPSKARAPTPSRAESPPVPAAGNSFAIRNVRVFDGMRVIDRANVVVRDGRIATIGPDAAIPAGLDAIDGAGKTLLPALIDAHVHAWGSAQRDALRFGVGTELDMLGDWRRSASISAQRTGYEPADQADLWTAGAAVTAPGGHGTQFYPVPALAPGDDVDAFVAARIAEGSDYIKIIVEPGGKTRLPTLDADQVRAAVAAAHARKRMAVVHVSDQQDAKAAIGAGADGLVHVFSDTVADADFLREARARDAFVIPTLTVMATTARTGDGAALAADPRLLPWLTPEQGEALKAVYPVTRPDVLDRALRNVRALHAAGVPILAGTDAGNPGTTHGASMHAELELLVRAGLSPIQALAAATFVPAQRFKLDDRGRIAPGLRADLLLLEGDPTREIRATRAIDGIWKNGYAVARTRPAAAAASEPIPAGALVADFDNGRIGAPLGTWQEITDARRGGKSTAIQRLVEGGADGTRDALEVVGEVRSGFTYPFAGTQWQLASAPGKVLDASSRSALVFRTRGDGQAYAVMLFYGLTGQAYLAQRAFTAGPQWREVRIELRDLPGLDLARLSGIAFIAEAPAKAFHFQLDGVELR